MEIIIIITSIVIIPFIINLAASFFADKLKNNTPVDENKRVNDDFLISQEIKYHFEGKNTLSTFSTKNIHFRVDFSTGYEIKRWDVKYKSTLNRSHTANQPKPNQLIISFPHLKKNSTFKISISIKGDQKFNQDEAAHYITANQSSFITIH